MNETPLGCRDIRHGFDHTAVLDGVTVDVPQGAVFGLVGRNGAGKSTLIRILVGLLRPQGGKSWVFGCDSLALNDAVKQRLGYVPQQPNAFPWLEVGQMLDFLSGFYPSWDAAYVEHMLERLAISPYTRISKLSPGQRESLALIRALAIRPDLLVLDEPAAALDPVERRELLREIAARVAESGTTVLFSTHIVTDLERVASHVGVLHGGRLMVNAAVDDLKETHARLTLPGGAGTPQQLPGEIARRRQSDGSLWLVLARRLGDPWPVLDMHPGARLEGLSLEDLVVELIR